MKYWANRLAKAQSLLTEKNIKQIEKQLAKYYSTASRRVIRDFERTYDKVLLAVEEGKEPTPADLYKLDAYWQMQGQLKREMQKLGDKQLVVLNKYFELHFFDIYYSIALEGGAEFTTLDTAAVQQLLNTIWVADGKTFSQRVWDNTERLMETLNNELIHCVATGKKTTELKNLLQERFGVSYRRADTLVRTEMVHIQTQAAQKRYQDYGVEYVEVLVDEDERTCDLCKELKGKKYPVHAVPPLPVHPNERCCLVPVIE